MAKRSAPKKQRLNADVIIVGAGPVGLALAKGLAIDGRSVLLLEKKPSLSQHSKAVTIWSGTQDVFERLGLLTEFEHHSLCRDDLNLWDADKNESLVHLSFEELAGETAHARLLLLPQNVTEEVLFEGLESEKKVETIFEATVTTLIDEGEGVCVKYVKDGQEHVVRSRFAVGCDGAHSVVRSALGLHLEGETYKIKAGLADVELADLKREYEYPRVSTKGTFTVGIRASDKLWRLIFIERADVEWNLEGLTRAAVQNIFGQSDYKLIWTSDFKLHRRTAEKFAQGNLVLAGDAAHLNSPIGGQGMNSGIQDTELLREALAMAFAQDSSQPLLDYAVKRREQVRHGVNRYTGVMTSLLFARGGSYAKDVVRTLNLGFKIPAVRHFFLRRAMMLNQNH
jgi:2-polyprenyl-6-methoxyphenol hydroxylase-like FAD-dependent oxidoreductase